MSVIKTAQIFDKSVLSYHRAVRITRIYDEKKKEDSFDALIVTPNAEYLKLIKLGNMKAEECTVWLEDVLAGKVEVVAL